MRLDRLLGAADVLEVRGDPSSVAVAAVVHDSRRAGPGALFCCLPGATTDGHDHAGAAVAAGGVALLVERMLPLDVVQVRVADARAAMARAAAAFHGHPSADLRVVGVTGTNGKTTTTHLLGAVLEAHGWPTAVVGTITGAGGPPGKEAPAGGAAGPGTTPEAPDLQARLAAERDAGRRAVALEVSSHALVQHRVDGVHFAVAAFTNLSQDHLDFHPDVEAYFAAKASLFDPDRAEVGVVNADDPYGRRLLRSAPLPLLPFSLADAAGLRVAGATSTFTWRGERVELHLGGRFNVANALCAATAAAHLGVPPATVAVGLSSLASVPGRFERVDAGQPFTVVVDYAHTPAALESVLLAAREVAAGGRVIAVFGCGGDRDRTKRPVMGALAARLADVALVTSDNPRGEDPLAVIEEVRAGAGGDALRVEPDRAAAIEVAVADARPGDVVVVAGKGHETGQTVGRRTEPFDDREVVRAALAGLGHRRAS